MHTEKKITINIGGGLSTFLTLIFVILKANDKIDWSWWWVLSPLWITGIIVLVILIIFAIYYIYNAIKYK